MKKMYPLALAATAALCGAAQSSRAAIMETTANDGDIHLVYAPATGNLTVSVNGNSYGTVTLAATTAVFKAGTLGTSPEYYEGDTGQDLSFGVLAGTQTADVTLPGVLLTNESEVTLLSSITVTSDTQGPATSKFSFTGGLTAVPEPTSIAFFSLGVLVALKRRNKP